MGAILEISIAAYERAREGDDLWKTCEGKQVLNEVARAIGFAGAPALLQAAFATWERQNPEIPNELIAFRQYLAGI